MEYKKIYKGDKFLCIKDVYMENGELAYMKNRIYVSENDGCITDNRHDEYHIISQEFARNYFQKKTQK